VLDDLRATQLGLLRVETGRAACSALAEQVPALVELDLDGFEPAPVLVARRTGRLALPELVLLEDELLDCPVDLRIVGHEGQGYWRG
jgi:hypothetical protein